MFAKHPVGRLITSLALGLVSAYADLSLFLPALGTWYSSLQKPPVVPSVTLLYYGIIALGLLIGVGMYLLWNAAERSKDARLAVWLVVFALILNVGWFFAFFWIKSLFFGMVILLILLSVLAAICYQAIRSAVLSILFFFPYFVVTLVALYINVLIYLMNPNSPLLGFVL